MPQTILKQVICLKVQLLVSFSMVNWNLPANKNHINSYHFLEIINNKKIQNIFQFTIQSNTMAESQLTHPTYKFVSEQETHVFA